jgi:hypothetical protein
MPAALLATALLSEAAAAIDRMGCMDVPAALTNWSASMSTVFRLNFRLQKLKRSSKLGPSRSMTMTL